MRIGFVNIYSYRPHVEHLFYLSKLVESDGHEPFYLTCDSDVAACYTKILRDSGSFIECSKCIVGGIRSFTSQNVSSIGLFKDNSKNKTELSEIRTIVKSSSATLTRIELDDQSNLEPVIDIEGKLLFPTERVLKSAYGWITENQLDAVICFNGRMELTRAVTAACEKLGVPFVTHERPWMGHGIQLIPNGNCLSLEQLNRLVKTYDSLPLTYEQASHAAYLLSIRFQGLNQLEWRVYNKNATKTQWPAKLCSSSKKVLILPSSRNEFIGHPERETGWNDNNEALDDFMTSFNISKNQVLVRFHPNWSESIGKVSGNYPKKHYEEWCRKRDIAFIPAEDSANTYDLIREADIVIMNGGSSAVEAAFCGKQVICLSPSNYQSTSFVTTFLSKQEMIDMKQLPDHCEKRAVSSVLRYVYVMSRRYPQYVDFVRAKQPTEYKYYEGADPKTLIDLLQSGKIKAFDETYSKSESEERKIVDDILSFKFERFKEMEPEQKREIFITRRIGFKWVDTVRAKLKRGDL